MLKRISCRVLSMLLVLGVFVQQVTAFEELSALPQENITTETIVTEESTEITLEDDSTTEDNETEDSATSTEEENTNQGPDILVDDTVVENVQPYLHEGSNYVPLRAMAQAIRPDAVVAWDVDHAIVTAENLSFTVYPYAKYIVANDRCLYVPHGVLLIDGAIWVPVRVLAAIFDAQVHWDAETGNTTLIRGSGALLPADQYYNSDSLYWLSHIIHAESGNQPLNGKIAVGNVVLNRVANPIFPDTIYGVVFQTNQFTPVRNGTIYLNPNAESMVAAKLCLEGAVILPDALWFNRAGITCWASRNKQCIATIGNHAFYA